MAYTNPQKKRQGIQRLWHALRYSVSGLHTAWQGSVAFRQEVLLAVVLTPLAFFVGQNWLEVALLIASVGLVLVVEILNTAIEAAIDRIGPEWHPLSKQAKDLGSAAVLLSLLLCLGIWLAALVHRSL